MIECVAGSGLLFVFCGFSFFCLVLNKNQFLISLNCAVLQLCIDFFFNCLGRHSEVIFDVYAHALAI